MTETRKAKRGADRPRQKLPEARTIKMSARGYQPKKAELEEEFDTPGVSRAAMRRAVFRPITVETEDAG